jgi:hypothetical protein
MHPVNEDRLVKAKEEQAAATRQLARAENRKADLLEEILSRIKKFERRISALEQSDA